MKDYRLGVVLLAAGASRRMGRPKLLLPWTSGTILQHLLSLWNGVGARQIGIVCATTNVQLDSALNALNFPPESRIVNPAPEWGMFSSIRCAAQWNGWAEDLTHWAIALGDQPLVHLRTLQTVAAFATMNPENICQPSRNARPRHPVLIPRRIFFELRDCPESDLKQFLLPREAYRKLIEIDDAGLDCDLDAPEDYERARRAADASTGD